MNILSYNPGHDGAVGIHPTNQVYVNSKRFLKGDLIKTRLQVQVLR
jgi:hypothetical protein